ncbi:MAG: response regulator [Provencibacterium sp.]|nr:response regulator [Provencibacterium sp.]
MVRIMVVDNDSTTLAICKGLLEEEYKVDLMKSGLQALGFLMKSKHQTPDLILLAMHMPGTGGMETLQSIRNNAALASIPVLFLSESEMDDDRAELEGYQNGVNDFVKKPILPDLLKVKVKRQLEIAALRNENAALRGKINRIRTLINSICSENL